VKEVLKQKCCLCKKSFNGYGNNSEPIKQGTCCDSCNNKVITARLNCIKWREVITNHLCQTVGINNAIADNYKFAKTIMKCLGRYANMDWGETCKEDCNLNNSAVFFNDDRVVAKYETNKGNIFIITEHDRSNTTIMFAEEY
jgi:hypothetical protein